MSVDASNRVRPQAPQHPAARPEKRPDGKPASNPGSALRAPDNFEVSASKGAGAKLKALHLDFEVKGHREKKVEHRGQNTVVHVNAELSVTGKAGVDVKSFGIEASRSRGI